MKKSLPKRTPQGNAVAFTARYLQEMRLGVIPQKNYPAFDYFENQQHAALMEYDGYEFPEQTVEAFYDIYPDVLGKYPPAGEGYHNAWHIQKMLAVFDNSFYMWQKSYPHYWDQPYDGCMGNPACREKVKEIGLLAILFHDIGYMEGAEGHEDRSADFAEAYLRDRTTIQLAVRQGVAAVIRFTKMDYSNEIAYPLKYFVRDLDWVGFRDYDTMVVNEGLLKQENPKCTKKQFREKALEFYASLLTKQIFHTPLFTSWNIAARYNIKRRIFELKVELDKGV